MNFEYRNTNKSEIAELNTWTNIKNATSSSGKPISNIRLFISTPETPRLGDHVAKYMKQNEEGTANRYLKTVYSGEQIVGVVIFIINSTNDFKTGKQLVNAEIQNLVVNPNIQNRGYGTAIVFDIVKNRSAVLGCNPSTISALVAKSNFASEKVFLKNEFKHVATHLDYFKDYEKFVEEKPNNDFVEDAKIWEVIKHVDLLNSKKKKTTTRTVASQQPPKVVKESENIILPINNIIERKK